MTLELHPLCTLFPRLQGLDFDAFCADIRTNGLREPIVLHNGMILDGGNRYRACLAVGAEPHFVEFSGDSLVQYVLSKNLHRRHMTPGQQAAIVASAQDWAKAQPEGRPQKQCNVAPLSTAESRAAESGASLRTQKMADKVAKADPALAKQVAHGDVSLPKAVRQVEEKTKPSKATETAASSTLEQRAPGKATKVTAKTAAELEREQAQEDAYGDTDPLDLLDGMQKQIEDLTALVSAAEADDLKAEAIKWRRISEAAQRAQSDYMDRLQVEKKEHEKTYRKLQRCGKAVGETDPDKIAPAVEAFVRQHKAVAA